MVGADGSGKTSSKKKCALLISSICVRIPGKHGRSAGESQREEAAIP